MPTMGRVFFGETLARQAPTTAPAAWLSADLQMEFNPKRPPAHKIIIKSGDILCGGKIGENATVDAIH